MKKNINTIKGFTLVETLVAISILVVVITGAYSAAQTGISSSSISKEQITAFYLAQQQIEALRNIRDEISLNGQSWSTFESQVTAAGCISNNGCFVEPGCWFWGAYWSPCAYGFSILNSCTSSGCPYLYQRTTDGTYGYITGTVPNWVQSSFRPKVQIDRVGGNELSVLVTVEWTKGNVTRNFKVRENLYDWQ